MNLYSRILLVLGIMLCSALSFAQVGDVDTNSEPNIFNLDNSIATTDNLFAPVTNPALLGTNKAGGLGWVHLFDDRVFQYHYWFVANLESISYVYEYDNGVNHHTLATGTEMFAPHIFRNLYLGMSYNWKNNNFKDENIKSGLVYRPLQAASIAMTLDHPFKESPAYRFGLGLRPFAFIPSIKDYRTELSIDMPYQKDGEDYTMMKPTLGINTQILDGLNLGLNYNMEDDKALMLNFSLSSRKSSVGTISHVKDKDNYALAYAHFTDESFKPVFGITPKTWYDMKLKGSLVTFRSPKYQIGPFSLFDSKTKGIEDVIREINQAKNDPSIHGILLKNPSFSASFALQQELLTVVKEFKSKGKQVAIYYDNMTNGAYIFAASIADKIYLNPNGVLDLKGFSVNSPYLREMLDALGIEVINFRSHDYKTAGNMFSEKEMTAAERKVYDELLGDLYAQVLTQISEGRGERLKKPISQLIDEGPYYISTDALNAGLVDNLIYLDQLSEQLKEDFGFKKSSAAMENYQNYNWAEQKEHQIAVIYAQGNIVMGKGNPGQKIAHETTVEKIRAARKNQNYKGIILRIDSGGGSAQASDIIWRELELARIQNKKTIVVSMSGVAGSGGYYIACNADKIVANPGTITGSIGVIGLAFNAEQMFKKIKINWSTVNKGKRADFGSMNRAWREDEKDLMVRMIHHSYEDFTGKVAKGRNMDINRVKELAQGRVWTGNQAKENGLIDELGGLDEAVRQMRQLTGIKGKIRLVDATSSTEGIAIEMKSDPLEMILPLDILDSISKEYIQVYELWQDFGTDPILMLAPMAFDGPIN